MTDDKGAGMNEQMYSDVMTDTQASRFGGYSDGYNAGRKAERERCLEIARGFSSCEGIAQKIAKEIEEAQDGK